MSKPVVWSFLALSVGAVGFLFGRATSATQLSAETSRTVADSSACRAALTRLGSDIPSEARLDEVQALLLRWAESDPRAALAYADAQFTAMSVKERFVTVLLAAWAKREPLAAWQWLQATAAGVKVPGAQIEVVLQEMGKTDPAAAWQAALEQARKIPSEAPSALGAALKGMMYAGHFESALRFVEGADLSANSATGDQPDTASMKDSLAALITAEWGRYQPSAAQRWAFSLPDAAVAHYEQALGNLITLWVDGLDRRAAADRVAHLPPGKLRQLATKSTLRLWLAEGEIDQITDWLGTIEPHADFDGFLYETLMSERVREGNARIAIRWAKALHDPELRVQGLTEIMTKWAEWDRSAAFAYLQTSAELPAETRQEVRRRLEKDI